MSACGHPDRLITYNSTGADGTPYQSVRMSPCECGQTPPPPPPPPAPDNK
ncbi:MULTISPECIES: hypothetical protein [unclassified Streptomyces]|nr:MULTISPECIES: hypothetical protein [unclassified Streptomyces]MYR27802.1 hypothetical protein [Streptomyces sp. SID4945]